MLDILNKIMPFIILLWFILLIILGVVVDYAEEDIQRERDRSRGPSVPHIVRP